MSVNVHWMSITGVVLEKRSWRIFVRAVDVVRRRGYCDQFDTTCMYVCGCVCKHDRTKTPDRNGLKLGSVLVPSNWTTFHYVVKTMLRFSSCPFWLSGLHHQSVTVTVCIMQVIWPVIIMLNATTPLSTRVTSDVNHCPCHCPCPCRSSPWQVLFLNLACNTHSIVLMVIYLFESHGFTVICCEFSLCGQCCCLIAIVV